MKNAYKKKMRKGKGKEKITMRITRINGLVLIKTESTM